MGYLSSNREGAQGSIDDEIYLVQEKCEIVVFGTVFDQDSKALLPGAEVLLLDSNNNIVDSMMVGQDAAYSFNVDCEQQYSLRGSKAQYAPYEKVIQTPDESGTVEVPIPLKLIDPCPVNDLGCRLNYSLSILTLTATTFVRMLLLNWQRSWLRCDSTLNW
jgi:hypothetical protein